MRSYGALRSDGGETRVEDDGEFESARSAATDEIAVRNAIVDFEPGAPGLFER